MAAFVASCSTHGERVSAAYCSLAEQWASELEHELANSQEAEARAANEESAEQLQQEQRELKARLTMCHYLVLIACGCSAAPGTVSLRDLAPYAAQLCKHMLLVCPQVPCLWRMPVAGLCVLG